MRSSSSERKRGALLGMACGDALGTTLEFKRLDAPPFPTLADGPHRDITGGGPFGVEPGQVTDDTQMACCLAASLVEHGRFDAADVGARYAEWRKHAFDIGTLTSTSLAELGRGSKAPGRDAWLASGKKPAGNGSLMRTTPIGVAFADDAAARRAASLGDSAITHYDPRCQIACAAFNAAVAAAIRGEPMAAVAQAADDEVALAAGALAEVDPGHENEVASARAALHEDLALAREPDPRLYGPALHIYEHQGFVRVAFRLAFWELLHAPSYEAALVDAVNRGGDADTNGAIVGGLLGAVYGEEGIPDNWRRRVLGALRDAPGPLRREYHPQHLLTLVEGEAP